MSIEMLVIAVAGVQTAIVLGVLGLMTMLLNGRMASIEAQQRSDNSRLESKIDGLVQSQHQDYKDLSAKIDQVLLGQRKERETA